MMITNFNEIFLAGQVVLQVSQISSTLSFYSRVIGCFQDPAQCMDTI